MRGRRRVRQGVGLLFKVLAAAFLLSAVYVLWLPDVTPLKRSNPKTTSYIELKRAAARRSGRRFAPRLVWVPWGRISEHLKHAVFVAEDDTFYRHKGVDWDSVKAALRKDWELKRLAYGGSTITQQVAKNLVVGSERTLLRKTRELLAAVRLESFLTKDEILMLYLNEIYFGHRCYGVQEASRFYFGKDVSELGLSEAALLAALPKSPVRYSPVKNPERARERRDWVLGEVLRRGWCTSEEAERARAAPLGLVAQAPDFFELAPYYAEHCRRVLEERLGRDRLYRGAYRVDLALDLDQQLAAQAAVARGLREIDRRHGWRGPLGRVDPEHLEALRAARAADLLDGWVWSLRRPERSSAEPPERQWRARPVVASVGAWLQVPVVALEGEGAAAVARVDLGSRLAELRLSQVEWARPFAPTRTTPAPRSVSEVLNVGDVVEVELGSGEALVRLGQPPLVQGALAALQPDTRGVTALVGGADFRLSPLVRAVQSVRQPGSAFKPIVYASALAERLITPASVLMDSPEVYRESLRRSAWKPQNFERQFQGPVSARHALAHSINTVAVKLTHDLKPETVIGMARALGVRSELKPNLSLALGASEVNLLELTNAYAAIADGGLAGPPVFITRLEEAGGEPLPLPAAEKNPALGKAEAYVLTRMLQAVVEEGSGRRARRLGRPVAGKTGTANEHRDAWFVGFSADLAAGVWVGFDDHQPLGGWAQGAAAALPIWVEFMERAHAGRGPRAFPVPPDVVFARVDPLNGLLAQPGLREGRFEAFVEGTEPRAVSSRTAATSAGSQAGDLEEAGPERGSAPTELQLSKELFR